MYDILTLQAWIRALYDVNNHGSGSRLWIEPYSYTMTFTALAAVAGTQTQALAINANADFVCTRISYTAVLGTAQNVSTKPVAQVRALLTDAGSSRPFFNQATALENFASNEFPNRFLPYPRWLAANTTITGQLTGYGTAAETYTIDLCLDGVAVRQYSAPM